MSDAPPDQIIDPATANTEQTATCLDQQIKQLLASLGETDRGVLLMLLENIPNEQIADVMGISAGAIRVRLHRIRKRIEEGEA